MWVEVHVLILGMVTNFGIRGFFMLDTALATAYCKPSRALSLWDRMGRFITEAFRCRNRKLDDKRYDRYRTFLAPLSRRNYLTQQIWSTWPDKRDPQPVAGSLLGIVLAGRFSFLHIIIAVFEF